MLSKKTQQFQNLNNTNNTTKTKWYLSVFAITFLISICAAYAVYVSQNHSKRWAVSGHFSIHKESGYISGIPAYEAPFPNVEDRSNPKDISLLVIHDTEIVPPTNLAHDKTIIHYMFTQQYERLKQAYPLAYAEIFPEGKTRDVASHLVIRRNGEVIQYASFNRLAHHAGISEFEKRENCNDFSIGIELEGYADKPEEPYLEVQYQQLAKLTNAILDTYSEITLDRIVGHEDIGRPLGRKNDPGYTFDWLKYRNLIEDRHHHKLWLNKIFKINRDTICQYQSVSFFDSKALKI